MKGFAFASSGCTLFLLVLLSVSAPAQWSVAGPMNHPRGHAGVVELANGEALAVGGSSLAATGSVPLHSAERYDRTTNAWTPTGAMAVARSRFCLVALDDGRVLAIGGRTTTGLPTSSVEIYDPAFGAWNFAGSLMEARENHTATMLKDGRVLVTGGTASPLAEIFDVQTGRWTSTRPMNHARSQHTATLLNDGRVLIAGGLAPFPVTSVAVTEVYDPQSDVWSASDSLLTPRFNHVAGVIRHGHVILTGGTALGAQPLQATEIWHSHAETWVPGPPLSSPRLNPSAIISTGGHLVVIGGSLAAAGSWEVLDPLTGIWNGSTGSGPGAGNITSLSGGQALVVGGGIIASPNCWLLAPPSTTGAVTPVGSPCQGSARGIVPTLTPVGLPSVGNLSFHVNVTHARPNSGIMLLLGPPSSGPPHALAPGCVLALDPPFVVGTFLLGLNPIDSGVTDAQGKATFGFGIVDHPVLMNQQLVLQAVNTDPASVHNGFTPTNGLHLLLQ